MTSSAQRVWIAHALIGLMVVLFIALIGRMVYIQKVMRPELTAWTQERLYSEIPISGRRGKIYDRKHRLLAGSHDRPTVFADPFLIEDKLDAAKKLATILPVDEEELHKKLREPTSPRYVVLAREVETRAADAVRALVSEEKLEGIGIVMEPTRDYPQGGLAAVWKGSNGSAGNTCAPNPVSALSFAARAIGSCSRNLTPTSRRKTVCTSS